MKQMMNCQHCQAEIVRKASNQKYCTKCNGIVNRLRIRKKYPKNKIQFLEVI